MTVTAADGTSPLLGSFRYVVTDALVETFAAITDDRSSLHVDPEFGRRSAYRQRVAHGMLSVVALAGLPLPERFRAKSIDALAARFLEPVCIGDVLDVVAWSTHPERIAIEVRRGRTVVTAGVVELVSQTVDPLEPRDDTPLASVSGLVEANYDIDDLAKGHEESIDAILETSLFDRMVGSFGVDSSFGLAASEASKRRLLAAALLSPLVGMRLPGRRAVFTDFEIRFADVPCDRNVRLSARVRFGSRSTRTLRCDVDVSGAKGAIAAGRFSARVDVPPTVMPRMEELASADVDRDMVGDVVVVTGASRGIGETTAKLFALRGAHVVVGYFRGAKDAARVVSEIEGAGGTAIAIGVDVRDEDQVRAFVARVVERFGRIDVVVNNAIGHFRTRRFEELSWAEIQDDLDVVLKGSFLVATACAPFMPPGGRMIQMSSLAVDEPPVGHLPYVVAKSALEGFGRSLAVELASRGIRVRTVVPSMVSTDLTRHRTSVVLGGGESDHALLTPADVARAVVMASRDETATRIVLRGESGSRQS